MTENKMSKIRRTPASSNLSLNPFPADQSSVLCNDTESCVRPTKCNCDLTEDGLRNRNASNGDTCDCFVEDDSDDEYCGRSAAEETESEAVPRNVKPKIPCRQTLSNDKPFYTSENAHLYPELRQHLIPGHKNTPSFQPMGAPPLPVLPMNVCPPSAPKTAHQVRSPCSNPCNSPSYNAPCHNPVSNPFHPITSNILPPGPGQCSSWIAQAPNAYCSSRAHLAQSHCRPRPQTGMQSSFIGQIPAFYAQASPTDCNHFTSCTQSYSRAQTAPGFKVFPVPGQGPFTKPPATAQNMLYQMGLAPPPTASIGTNPPDQFCFEDSSQLVEQIPGQAPDLGQTPNGVENPYGHFSNNCNFFIYNVQGQGMTHSLEPYPVASGPPNHNNVADQMGSDMAAHSQQGAFRPPNFYRPSPFPVPRAAGIRSMLRPFKRFF